MICKPCSKNGLTRVWSDAFTLVRGNKVGLEVGVDGIVAEGASHFLDGVGDEDERDEAGEALLGEACHVFDDVAGISGHQEEALDTRVHADPQPQLHVVHTAAPRTGSVNLQY